MSFLLVRYCSAKILIMILSFNVAKCASAVDVSTSSLATALSQHSL